MSSKRDSTPKILPTNVPLKIRVSTAATLDLREIVAYIREESGFRAGTRRRSGLLDLIRTLDSLPLQGALVAEEELASEGVRQMRYHSHRIIYRVTSDEVQIVRIYHVRSDGLRRRDLPPDASSEA